MPSPSHLAEAAAPSRRQRRRVKGRKFHIHVFNYYHYPPPPPVVVEERDWTELPLDVAISILRRLDPVELLGGGATGACRSWRRATRDEPELWRRIDMRGCSRELSLGEFAREAVRRSAGRCEAFWGEYFGDDDFLLFLADQAPSLTSLRLNFFYKVTNEGFVEAITKFPLLEELELENCHSVDDPGVFEFVAKACPRLKHFRHIKYRSSYHSYDINDPNNDREATAIASMHELRSLQLFRDTLTNQGLTAILDNCPHLESLGLRSCGNLTMDGAMRAKCARIKNKTLVQRHSKDGGVLWDFEAASRISFCSTFLMSEYFRNKKQDNDYDSDNFSDFYYCFLGDLDETHLEEHGRMLGKSIRRYKLVNGMKQCRPGCFDGSSQMLPFSAKISAAAGLLLLQLVSAKISGAAGVLLLQCGAASSLLEVSSEISDASSTAGRFTLEGFFLLSFNRWCSGHI